MTLMDDDTPLTQSDLTAAPDAPLTPETAASAPEPVISEEDAREANAMRVWREASKLFSGLRYGLSTPWDAWFQTRRQFGDTVTTSRQLRYWKKLKTLTDTLSDAELEYVRFLALQRFEFAAAIFRVNAVTSITLPITAAVVANQLYPGVVQKFLEEDSLILVGLFLLLVVLLAAVFGNVFKARELKMALELEAARRRLRRGDAARSSETLGSEFDMDAPIT